jgi:hypothetical protein
MSHRALGPQFLDVHRGLVIGSGDFEDRHVARFVEDNLQEPGSWWTRDEAHARERYTGGPGQTGVVLHGRVRVEDAQERRGEVWVPPGRAEVRGHTAVRR